MIKCFIYRVVAKPIESMNKLIKKDRRVGSADNLGTTISTGISGSKLSIQVLKRNIREFITSSIFDCWFISGTCWALHNQMPS